VDNERRLAQLREALLKALGDNEPPAATPAGRKRPTAADAV
jgi:hypothetical protein